MTKYTKAEDRIIREGYERFESARDIGERIGRSAKSVSQRAVLIGASDKQHYAERMRRKMRELRRRLPTPPHVTREFARAMGERRLAWCPAEWREEYRLIRNKVGKTEARRIIEAEIAASQRREAA